MNTQWTIVPARPEHIPAIAADMRAADAREVWASHRHTPQEALEMSLAHSDLAWTCFVAAQEVAPSRMLQAPEPGFHSCPTGSGAIALSRAEGDGCEPGFTPGDATSPIGSGGAGRAPRPSFMWGVARHGSIMSATGHPWLLGTPRMHAVQREFLRQCRQYVNAMQEAFPLLENFVHAQNRASIRWLRWCGFTVETKIPELINDEDFYRFWRVQNA